MRIQSDQKIAGVPILDVRRALKLMGKGGPDFEVSVYYFEQCLGLPLEKAKAVLDTLVQDGLLTLVKNQSEPDCKFYKQTIRGHALMNAKAAKPLLRASAERILSGFMDRVRAVNANEDYHYTVEYVALFGSMLTKVDRLGDIDLIVKLQYKGTPEGMTWTEWRDERVEFARHHGRRFSTLESEIYWPEIEVRLALKARSRALSIHEVAGVNRIPGLTYKVLYGSPLAVAAEMPYAICL